LTTKANKRNKKYLFLLNRNRSKRFVKKPSTRNTFKNKGMISSEKNTYFDSFVTPSILTIEGNTKTKLKKYFILPTH